MSIYDWQISTKRCKCRRDKWNKRWNRLISSNCLWVTEWVSSNDWFPPRIRLHIACDESFKLCTLRVDAMQYWNSIASSRQHYITPVCTTESSRGNFKSKKNETKINLNDFKGISCRCTKSNPEITNSGQSIASFPWSTSVPHSTVRSISDWHGRHSQMLPTIGEGYERWHIVWIEPRSLLFIVNARDVLIRMCVRLRTCLAVDCVPVADTANSHIHTHFIMNLIRW